MSSSITVAASDLSRMLSILADTAAKPNANDLNYPAIALFTRRGSMGAEVGEATFLCGISTSMSTVGTESIVGFGELQGVWLLTPSARMELMPVLGSWIKEDPECQVSITVGESGATTVKMESATDRAIRFYMRPDDGTWPMDEACDMLTGEASQEVVTDRDGRELPAGKRIRLSAGTLNSLAKVAKKTTLGSVDIIIPAHPASVLLVESDSWAGAILGEEYMPDTDVMGREVEFMDPRRDEGDSVV